MVAQAGESSNTRLMRVPQTTSATGPGWDIARGIVFTPGSVTQGYVADGWGGMHAFGGAPSVSTSNATPGGIVKQLSIA